MSRIVLKVGGRVAAEAVEDALVLRRAGHEVVVVHGAGPQISAEMERLGIAVDFVGGRRVPTGAAVRVVRRSLAAVNESLCAALAPCGVGFMGDEIGLQATQVPALGLVGDPLPSRPAAVEWALSTGLVPVVAPIAEGPLNVNADEAAAALAVGLEADRILFVSDVPGVLLAGGVLDSLGADDADRMLGDGAFEGGIVPKLNAAVRAARLGVKAEIGATEVLV